jgi:choline dehydrogenase-like flavoprotein
MNILVTPSSRGTVTLRSTDPFDSAICDPNILSNESDRQLFFSVVRLTSNALEQSIGPEYGLAEYGIDESIKADYSDDAIMQRCIRIARPVNHGSGTCAMGSVVDAECRVKGIEGLRVIDSSVIPLPLCGHYQAAVYAMAEQVSFLRVCESIHRATLI